MTKTEMSEAARAMAKARWKGVPAKERTRLMKIYGKLGGRPKKEQRCFCGAFTLKRAFSRNFDCCRAAGMLPLNPAESEASGSLPRGSRTLGH